ncbi:MAG TPA: glycosyltransferase family 4 protein [Acidobacteriota bacterium]|nr:glycosyltransferase family 4 protein [Acidobacteriota bacterium]
MTIDEARKDWRVLDGEHFGVPEGIRLISHEAFDSVYTEGLLPVEEVRPCTLSRLVSFCKPLSELIWAFQLLCAADGRTVVLANGSASLGNYACLLNYFLFFRRKVILFWDSHLEPRSTLKRYLARRCFLGCSLATFWSSRQPQNYSRFFGLPENLFMFIPYKANHSKRSPRDLQTLDFVFAGGNGKRDYRALVEAIRGTDVKLIISCTHPSVIKTIEDLPNVIPLAASEPSYSKLMALCRLVVIPMISTGLKGGGEANFCNGMWHGKPVIAMDDVSAHDYIIDGETGYIVPPGDIALLRERILELWNHPEKARTMGEKGRLRAQQFFTQAAGIRRLVRLACILGQEACNPRSPRGLSGKS